MTRKSPPGHRRPSDRQPTTARSDASTAVERSDKGESRLPGLMKTLASVSANRETSARERGGKGRNAKFHHTQMNSRLLRIDRESKKQPPKLKSQARPMPATIAALDLSLRSSSQASRWMPTPASTKTTGNENQGAIRPKRKSPRSRRGSARRAAEEPPARARPAPAPDRTNTA